MSPLPHDRAVDGLLHPALDAQAANDEQARLIDQPGGPVDSLAEMIDLVHPLDPALAQQMRGALRQLQDSNAAERACERTIAGTADDLARDLAKAQQAGRGLTTGARAIAGRIRDHVKVLAEPRPDGTAFAAACAAIRREARLVGVDRLRSKQVRNELGGARHDALVAHLDRTPEGAR